MRKEFACITSHSTRLLYIFGAISIGLEWLRISTAPSQPFAVVESRVGYSIGFDVYDCNNNTTRGTS
jgi:hypothetical protein